jgi:hypothetical protein
MPPYCATPADAREHAALSAYRVLVHGDGIVLRRWLFWRGTMNFYATRFVRAESEAAAQERALESLCEEPRLLIAALRPATLAITEMSLAEQAEVPDRQSGIIFYPPSRDC